MSHDVTHPAIRGTNIRMFRGGRGPTAVFLHGGAGLSVWTPFFQSLAEQHDLLVPEHPGFGQSDNPDWLNSVSDLALFYLDFLDQFDLQDVHLIGNSFGGWIAAELAVRDSSRLKSLTLIGPSGVRPAGDAVTDIFRWSYEENTRNLFHNQAIAERMLGQPPTLEGVAAQIKNQTTVARLGGKPVLYNPDLPRWLHRVRVPTHILWGQYDRLSPAATAQIWAQHLPKATVTIVPDAGHLPHAEQAGVVGPAVVKFLAAA